MLIHCDYFPRIYGWCRSLDNWCNIHCWQMASILKPELYTHFPNIVTIGSDSLQKNRDIRINPRPLFVPHFINLSLRDISLSSHRAPLQERGTEIQNRSKSYYPS